MTELRSQYIHKNNDVSDIQSLSNKGETASVFYARCILPLKFDTRSFFISTMSRWRFCTHGTHGCTQRYLRGMRLVERLAMILSCSTVNHESWNQLVELKFYESRRLFHEINKWNPSLTYRRAQARRRAHTHPHAIGHTITANYWLVHE